MAFAPDTVTQKTELGPEQRQVFNTLLANANAAFNKLNQIGPYGGDFISTSLPANLAAGRAGQVGGARAFSGSGAARDVLNLGQATARGDFVNPDSPVVQGMIQASTRPVVENYEQVVLPSLRGGAAGVGAFDNLRRNIVEGQAGRDLSNTISDVASNIVFANTQAERERQNNAGSIIAQALPLLTAPGAITAGVGEAERMDEDRSLQNELAKYEAEILGVERPFNLLSSALTPLLLTGTETTRTAPGVSPIASGISGAFGGAGTGAAIAQAAGSSVLPWALPLGLLGLIGGAFGG